MASDDLTGRQLELIAKLAALEPTLAFMGGGPFLRSDLPIADSPAARSPSASAVRSVESGGQVESGVERAQLVRGNGLGEVVR